MNKHRYPRVHRPLTPFVTLAFALASPALWTDSAFAQQAARSTDPRISTAPRTPSKSEVEKRAAGEVQPSGEPAVELSPFEVRADEDTGYNATNTLMGTRLNSELKDLPASISVVTKTFMDDINAKDLTSLFIYTLGTEVGGSGGNFSGLSDPAAGGVYDDALGQASPATRVRGLLSADSTRDYFLTDVPLDSYNFDRVDISRGPNAMLFGLGSPAGIYNRSLVKAGLISNKTSVNLQYGSFGSFRTTLDTNQVLIKNQLALRMAVVHDDTQFEQAFTYDRKNAITLTGTWRPFSNTVIKATTEWGRDNSNKPEGRSPYDQITYWYKMGMPVWNPITSTGRLLGTPQAPFTGANQVINATGGRNSNFIGTTLNNLTANSAAIVYGDPNSNKMGLDIGGGLFVDGFKGAATNGAANAAGTALVNQTWGSIASGVNMIRFGELNNALGSTLYTYQPQITDPRIFDFYHYSLEGPMKYEYANWSAYNITLEQTLFDKRAGFQVEFDRQYVDSGYNSPINYSLNVDINEFLPNGAPNPNFLRPINAGSGFKRVYSKDRQAQRATVYYNLDLRRTGPSWLGKILGRHMFNANYTNQSASSQLLAGTLWNIGTDYLAAEGQSLPGTISSTSRIVPVVQYYGPSLRNTTSAVNAGIQGSAASHDPSGLSSINILYNQRPATTAISAQTPWTTRTFNLVTSPKEAADAIARNGYSNRTSQTVHSGAITAQSHWLENTIVTTAGWRRDNAWSYDAGIAPQDPILGNAITNFDAWNPKLTTTLGEESTNWGVVGRLPERFRQRLPLDSEISGYYNQATNFRVAPQRYNVLGETVGPETGETKEYGIRISTFGGKLEFKAGHYVTSADKATVNGFVGSVNQMADLLGALTDKIYIGDNSSNPQGIAAWEAWVNGPYGQIYQKTFHYSLIPNTNPNTPAATYGKYADANGDRGNVVGTSALESKGLEFEMIFNPTRNWRIYASAGRDDAIRTNVAPELNDFINNSKNGLLTLVQNPDGTPTAVGNLLTTVSGNAISVAQFVKLNVATPMEPIFRQSGTRTDELRRWHWGGTTNYRFSDEMFGGKLRGFGIGGGVRFLDKIAIGYPVTTFVNAAGAVVPILDVFHPYFGPTEIYFDGNVSYTHRFRRFTWNARVYAQNIGKQDNLIPIYANPNGVVANWRIGASQTFTFSNTFSF